MTDRSARVLLLDPDEQAAETCQRACERRGWILHRAMTFAEGLDLIEKMSYDVVIMEVRLPDVVGTDAWRYIKAVLPNAFGIFVTGSPSLYDSIDPGERDILAFLLKPLDMDVACAYVDQVVARSEESTIERQISGLGGLYFDISQALDPEPSFQRIFGSVEKAMRPDAILVYLLNRLELARGNHFIRSYSSGEETWMPTRPAIVEDWIVDSARSQSLLIFDSSTVPEPNQHTPADVGASAIMIVPLLARNRTYGALAILFRSELNRSLAPVEIELARVVGRVIGLALDNARLERTRHSSEGYGLRPSSM